MHLKESWVRIPLPKDVRLSRQPLTGEHTKLGAILAGGDMVSPGLAEARYMPGTGRRRWELFPGLLEPVDCSWHRAHSVSRGVLSCHICLSVPMLCRGNDD